MALALMLLTGAAACGSDPKADDGIASLGTDATTGTTTGDTATGDTATGDTADGEDGFVAYASCMRDEGIDLPDPQVAQAGATPGAGGGPIINVQGSGGDGTGQGSAVAVNGVPLDVDADEFQAADTKCKPLLGDVINDIQVDPEVQAEQRAQMLAYSQCMRDNGVPEFPDPVFDDNGGVSIQIGGGEGEGAPTPAEQAALAAATDACADLMQLTGTAINATPAG